MVRIRVKNEVDKRNGLFYKDYLPGVVDCRLRDSQGGLQVLTWPQANRSSLSNDVFPARASHQILCWPPSHVFCVVTALLNLPTVFPEMADTNLSSPLAPSEPALQALIEGPDREAIHAEVPTAIITTEECNQQFDLTGVSHVVMR